MKFVHLYNGAAQMYAPKACILISNIIKEYAVFLGNAHLKKAV